MTELSFLIELLLNHELTKETKVMIAERIKEVEFNLNASHRPVAYTAPAPVPTHIPAHMPIPQEAQLAPNASVAPQVAMQNMAAQTSATAAAMARRNQLIANAGNIEKGKTSPRKF